jgi:UDP-3-O-[3-hydroxymyristoyl] glucosamine N-acyltransferase
VRIGKRNKVTAGVMICGSTVVGDDNWFGPGAIVSNLLKLGSRNYVALGANVLSDLEDEWKVVGTRVFRDRKLF